MSMFSTEPTMKFLKFRVSGPGGSGKTTFGTTFPGPRYWLDAEHSGDHIRDPKDPVLYTTNMEDAQKAVKEIGKNGAGSFIIDPVTILRDGLMATVEDESGDMGPREWSRVNRPERRLMINWQNLPCHVLIICHEKEVLKAVKNARGKVEFMKDGVKPDADKKIEYAPDIGLRFVVENGIHVAYIERIRIRKEIALKTGLKIGARIENPTFEHFLPIVEEYAKGKRQAHYAEDGETTEKNRQVLEQIDLEREAAAKKKVIGQIQRGEKKCRDLKIYGWQDDEQISSTRVTAMGTDNLKECAAEDLNTYVQGLKNQVNQYKQQKLQEA